MLTVAINLLPNFRPFHRSDAVASLSCPSILRRTVTVDFRGTAVDSAEIRTRVGVAHLMATYQYLADAGKVRQLSALFAPDAVFETNTGQFLGPEGVLGFFADTKDAFLAAGFLPARHYLSSVYVEPRTDGHAATYACFQFVGSRGLDHWGTYRDEVAPIGDTWHFIRRRVIVDGYAPDSPVPALLGLSS